MAPIGHHHGERRASAQPHHLGPSGPRPSTEQAGGDNPDLALAASPLTYLAELPGNTPLPDFIILHGARDTNIARGQSARLLTALVNREGAGRIEYHLLPEGTHGGGEFDRLDPMIDIIDFLRAALDD